MPWGRSENSETPHLGLLPLGRALYGSSPLTGNLIKMCNNVKPYKPDETRNSYERLIEKADDEYRVPDTIMTRAILKYL
uniref:Uncharacterized protein n=1 Tax=Ignisphaera aggregans TaxID=334771 RepID=A0A7J2U533_9CREN